MQEAWVQLLGWEDTLDKEMATHSSILAWRIPWMKEPSRPQQATAGHSLAGLAGSQESAMT